MPRTLRKAGPRSNPGGAASRAAALARSARNEAGLSVLLGGTLALAAYFAACLLPLSPWFRGILALIPFGWIAGKLALRPYVRRRLPGFVPRPTRLERTIHRITTIVVSVSCLGVLVFAAERIWGRAAPWEVYASLAFTVAMPIVIWRFLQTAEDQILGIFLMFQAVLILAGRPAQLGNLVHIPVVACVAMLVGARQHHEFLTLSRAATRTGDD